MKNITKYHIGLNTMLLFFFIGFSAQISAQSISSSVVGNAGDYYENTIVGSLHWTLGEVAVSLLQNGDELGQGFHRLYYDLIVSSDDISLDWEVNVFPNPTADLLQIKMPEIEGASGQLFNTAGQLLISEENLSLEASFDLSPYPAGSYWLRLLHKDGRKRSFQVVKVVR